VRRASSLIPSSCGPIPSHPIPRDHPRARTVVQLANLAQSNRFGLPVHHNPASPVLCAVCYRLNDCQPPTRSLRLTTTPLLDRLLACATTTADDTSPHYLLALLPPVASSFCSPRFRRLISRLLHLISISSRLASPRTASRLASLERRISLCSATRDATDRPIPRSRQLLSPLRQKQQPETHIAYHHPSLPRPATELLASAIAKPHAEPVRNCSPFQNAFARSALHLVSQDSASPRASFATHTPSTHHSAPCSRAVAVTASRSLSLSPSPSYYTPSQHPVYSPISRCTRTPPASQSLAKFRSALTLPPKGYRYCDTGTFLPILAIRTLPIIAHICAC
jgi:hypothetical protein